MNLLQRIINSLYLKYVKPKHKYPTSVLIHRRANASMVYEIEFNWFDENMEPVSVVRDVKTQKIFSIRSTEMLEFVEYTGSDPNPGE